MNNSTEWGLTNQGIPRYFRGLSHFQPELFFFFFLPQALYLIQTLKNQAIEVGRRPGQHMQKKSSKKGSKSVVCKAGFVYMYM